MHEVSYDLPQTQLTIRGLASKLALSGPELTIALHGWLDNCHSFLPLSRFLPDTTLLCIDLPGHGHSDHLPAGVDLHFRDYLLWLRELLECQKWSSITLMGHSMGAAIASLFAATFPEFVNKLILIEGIGPWAGSTTELPMRTRDHIESFLKIAHRQNPSYENFEHLVSLRQRSGKLSQNAARLLAERGTESDLSGRPKWRHDPRLKVASAFNFSEEQTLAFLRRIVCPSLIIRATDGLLKTGEPFDSRLAAITQLQRYSIDGHHHVHMEKPQEVAQIIHDFILSCQFNS